MRPFAELTADELRDAPGIACDFDDTVTSHGVLTAEALAAVHALCDAKIPMVIATGRPLGWAEVLARVLPVRAVVTENGGAWVLREGSRLRPAFAMDDDTRREGMARVDAMVAELSAAFPVLQRVQDLTHRATDCALDIHEACEVSDEIVTEAITRIRARGLYATPSTVHLHISAFPPDKAAGLRRCLSELGFDPAHLATRWVYVGDSPNDSGAFGAIARSIGVANVRAFEGRMTTWPAYVTQKSHGAGFAEVAHALVRAKTHQPPTERTP